jgi:hypothetical protein
MVPAALRNHVQAPPEKENEKVISDLCGFMLLPCLSQVAIVPAIVRSAAGPAPRHVQ